MTSSRWRGDCSRCAALCCLSFAFDRSESFAFEKSAGEPCPLLAPGHACSIHASRERRGLGGCVGYDCRGAGQRVTQEVFAGRSWQTEPGLGLPMLEVFWRMRQVHELLAGLALTDRLELDPGQVERRRALERSLEPAGGFSVEGLETLALAAVAQEVRAFLADLRAQLLLDVHEPPLRRRLPLAAHAPRLEPPSRGHGIEVFLPPDAATAAALRSRPG